MFKHSQISTIIVNKLPIRHLYGLSRRPCASLRLPRSRRSYSRGRFAKSRNVIGRCSVFIEGTTRFVHKSISEIMAIADDARSFMQTLLQNEALFMDLLSYIFLFWAFSVIVSLQYVSAPYGRYSRGGWGVLIPGKVAWFVQELPSFVVPLYLAIFTDCPRAGETRNQIALSLFLLHYFQRTFVFSCLIKGGKPTPLVPFVLAFIFCLLNGYLQGGHLLRYADLSTVSDFRFYAGILIFLAGMAINIYSDHVLRTLRKEGEKGYKIPYGGMFEYVSGANFFGESLEWIGLAVMCGTFPTLAFAIFTACNIGPRACQHHRWYQEKFDDYPKNRKAFIPFIL